MGLSNFLFAQLQVYLQTMLYWTIKYIFLLWILCLEVNGIELTVGGKPTTVSGVKKTREAGCVAITRDYVFKCWAQKTSAEKRLDEYKKVQKYHPDVEMAKTTGVEEVGVKDDTENSCQLERGQTMMHCLKIEKITYPNSFQLRRKNNKPIFPGNDRRWPIKVEEALEKAIKAGIPKERAIESWINELEAASKAQLTDPQGFFDPTDRRKPF